MHIRVLPCNVVLLVVMSHLVAPISCDVIDKVATREAIDEIIKMVVEMKYEEGFQIILDTEARDVAISEAQMHDNSKEFIVDKFVQLPNGAMKKLEMIATSKWWQYGSRLKAIRHCLVQNKDKIVEAVQTGFNVACYLKKKNLHLILVTKVIESLDKSKKPSPHVTLSMQDAMRLNAPQTIAKVSEFQASPGDGKAAKEVTAGLTKIFNPDNLKVGVVVPNFEEMTQAERTKLWSDVRKKNLNFGYHMTFKLEHGKVNLLGGKMDHEFKLDNRISLDAESHTSTNDITKHISNELAKYQALKGLSKSPIRFAVETGSINDRDGTWPICIILLNPKDDNPAEKPVGDKPLPQSVAPKTAVNVNRVPGLKPSEKIAAAVKMFVNNKFSTDFAAIVEMSASERSQISQGVNDESEYKETCDSFKFCFVFTIGPGGKNPKYHFGIMNDKFPGRKKIGSGEVISEDLFQVLTNTTAEAMISEHIESLLDEVKNEPCLSPDMLSLRNMANMRKVRWALEYVTQKFKNEGYVYFVLVINGE